MTARASQMAHLSSQLQGLHDHLLEETTVSVSPSPAAISAPTTPPVGSCSKLAQLEKFSREPGLCKKFIIDCSIHFELTPHAFPTDQTKIAFMISHLSGRAIAWASAEWVRNSPLCISLTEFQVVLQKTFDPGKGSGAEWIETRYRLCHGLCYSVSHSGCWKGVEPRDTL